MRLVTEELEMRRVAIALVVSAAAALGLSACDDDGGGGDGAEAGEQVTVVLSEFIIEPDRTAVPAGEVEFVVKNEGGDEHELEIVAAETAQALPTDEDGAAQVSEDQEVGEIEDVEPGATKRATFDLEPGSYVLICNIVEEEEDGTVESHFEEGMHTLFEAE